MPATLGSSAGSPKSLASHAECLGYPRGGCEEPGRLIDRISSVGSALVFGAELALVAADLRYTFGLHQALHLRQLPRSRMLRVLVQEVPATSELVVVKLDDEVYVPDSSDLGTLDSSYVLALRLVQRNPRAACRACK